MTGKYFLVFSSVTVRDTQVVAYVRRMLPQFIKQPHDVSDWFLFRNAWSLGILCFKRKPCVQRLNHGTSSSHL